MAACVGVFYWPDRPNFGNTCFRKLTNYVDNNFSQTTPAAMAPGSASDLMGTCNNQLVNGGMLSSKNTLWRSKATVTDSLQSLRPCKTVATRIPRDSLERRTIFSPFPFHMDFLFVTCARPNRDHGSTG